MMLYKWQVIHLGAIGGAALADALAVELIFKPSRSVSRLKKKTYACD